VRLVLDPGWRGFAFGGVLTALVTALFGIAPALQASKVQPMSTIRGGRDPHARPRLMRTLLAAQMAFCVLVLFVAGLFVSTFERLLHRPLGFSTDRILIMDSSASSEQPSRVWMQVADRLREWPGVESVTVSPFALLTSDRLTADVRVPGHDVDERQASMLTVSPRFFETMRIGMIAGRDLRSDDLPPRLDTSQRPVRGVGIVNEMFARAYFHGENPIGRVIDVRQTKDVAAPMEIVGYVHDIVYRDLREPIRPTLYMPIDAVESHAFVVRTAADPLRLATELRREVSRIRPDFRVRTVELQSDAWDWQMHRERLLATLSWFFALVALVLAAIGLYGVLSYTVTQQRREVGIRMALGARPVQVVRRIASGAFAVVLAGLAIGLAGGIACGRLL
jgi:predicted permease